MFPFVTMQVDGSLCSNHDIRRLSEKRVIFGRNQADAIRATVRPSGPMGTFSARSEVQPHRCPVSPEASYDVREPRATGVAFDTHH